MFAGITILGISLSEILLELIRTILIVSFATAIHVHLAEVQAHEAGLILVQAEHHIEKGVDNVPRH